MNSMREKLFDMIAQLTEHQCTVVIEAFHLSKGDPAKSPEECLKLAAERLGMSLDEIREERSDMAAVPPTLGRFVYENAGISEYKS